MTRPSPHRPRVTTVGTAGADAPLQQTVDRAVRRRAGVVAAHLTVDGEVSLGTAGHVSLPNGPRPGARTLFEIGSVTKTFTALLLARAVIDGDLTLDTEVGELVPEVRGIGRDGVPITLGHLATHTSGLPRAHLPTVRGSVQMLRGRDPWAQITEDGLLRAIRDGKVRRTPGSGKPAYSNSGFGLLGIALSRHAGTGYGELVAARITEPLGMSDTLTRSGRDADQRERTATGHHRRRTPTAPWPLDGLPGAGALLSTADDMVRYLQAHLRPPPGPLGAAITLATTEHAPGIGLAWQRPRSPGEPVLWHNGGTGGFRSVVGVRPRSGDALVMLANHARGVDLAGLRLLHRLSSR